MPRTDGICPKCGIAPKTKKKAYCRECWNKYRREWRKTNPEYYKAYRRKEKKQRKALIMSWYGSECVCCGVKNLEFLSLDHIHDDGIRERGGLTHAQFLKAGFHSVTGNRSYERIKKLGYENRPRDLQILCMNCQFGKRLNNGFCPHHPERDLRIAAGIKDVYYT